MSAFSKLRNIARDPKEWVNSPSFNNNVQKWTGKSRNFIMNIVIAIILLGVCYIILSPIFGIVSRAFMNPADLANPMVFLVPVNFTLDHVRFAIQYMNFWNTLLITLAFALGLSALHVIICSLVGYGFARFKFPYSNALFALCIVTIVVPVHAYMVPLFVSFRWFLGTNLNLIDNPLSIVLLTATGVGLGSGLYIYIFRQFFRGLPKEIEEAALIDGAGPLRTYAQVMLPNAIPAMVTVLLFAFVWHYNDTFYTSMLIPRTNLMSTMMMSVGFTFSNREDINNPILIQMVVFGGVLLVITPILTIYLILQRFFVEGLERSGIVG